MNAPEVEAVMGMQVYLQKPIRSYAAPVWQGSILTQVQKHMKSVYRSSKSRLMI